MAMSRSRRGQSSGRVTGFDVRRVLEGEETFEVDGAVALHRVDHEAVVVAEVDDLADRPREPPLGRVEDGHAARTGVPRDLAELVDLVARRRPEQFGDSL